MPRKDNPARSKKFDHPKDVAAGYRKLNEPRTPKHPKEDLRLPREGAEVKT